MNGTTAHIDFTRTRWRKSSHSGNGAACVEVSDDHHSQGIVPVRDSKNPASPKLVFTTAAWTAFVTSVITE
ncbi:DUF397 domain-containing protein [Streptomyces olivoreticuli]|uniref:DUF397 domain-containing protein n=1 Tax=Streptomyces olivoreticuli TaxID=68246 RepID=UPI001968819F|nr:DUF397 domain-containing protein [Streptomyces olivoreticuli]